MEKSTYGALTEMCTLEPDGDAARGPVAATVDHGHQVRSQVLDDDRRRIDKQNPDAAPALPISARSDCIVQAHLHAGHARAMAGQAESQSAPYMLGQCCSRWETPILDVELHGCISGDVGRRCHGGQSPCYGRQCKFELFVNIIRKILMINYKHLLYFTQVAKSGSVMRASEQLHVTPQTISGQIQLLEDRLGSALFSKSGRGLVLTEAGRLALGYAQDIFSLGAELEQAVHQHPTNRPALEFRIGVADALPKPIAYRLVEPATRLEEPVRLVCREWKLDSLLAELALHRLDLVLSDAPIPPSVSIKAFSHQLGASGQSFFASAPLAQQLPGVFPACLDGAPVLMPADDSATGQKLRDWFQTREIHPQVVGEFDDSALAMEFGSRGSGIFVGPTVLAQEICRQFGVTVLGEADGISVEYFAISVERRITHPCVIAITRSARQALFAGSGKSRSARRTPRS